MFEIGMWREYAPFCGFFPQKYRENTHKICIHSNVK